MIDQISDTLAPGGTVVVVEWDWNAFDEPTARWCFERLAATDPPGWLHRQRDEWAGSGRDWDAYLRDWTQREGLHAVERLLRSLNRRFEPKTAWSSGAWPDFPSPADLTDRVS